jgi:protein disulfide-isomerase A6
VRPLQGTLCLTKKLQPEWEGAAKKLKGTVSLGKVNCDEHQQLCQSFGVKGYPTIKYFSPQSKGPSDAQDYQGGREEPQIIKVGMDLFTKYGGDLELNQIVSQDSFKKDCLDSDKSRLVLQ